MIEAKRRPGSGPRALDMRAGAMFWTLSSSLCDIPVLELNGILDAGTRSDAWDALASHIATGGIGFPGHPCIILDLGKLDFLDSAGLAVLIRARKRCDAAGGWLILSSPQGVVRKFLDVMHMDTEFLIWEETREDSMTP